METPITTHDIEATLKEVRTRETERQVKLFVNAVRRDVTITTVKECLYATQNGACAIRLDYLTPRGYQWVQISALARPQIDEYMKTVINLSEYSYTMSEITEYMYINPLPRPIDWNRLLSWLTCSMYEAIG